MARWMLRRCSANTKELSKKTGISEIIISILANRGVKTEEEIIEFMNPKLENLHNPTIMKDMNKGIEIIKECIEHGKKIVVYGDYDKYRFRILSNI